MARVICEDFYSFLCKILGYVYKDTEKRSFFRRLAATYDPMDAPECDALMEDLIGFSQKVTKKYADFSEYAELLEKYYDNFDSQETDIYSFTDNIRSENCAEKKTASSEYRAISRILKNIFMNRGSVQNGTVFGLSYIFTKGIGNANDSNIYISEKSAYKILSECMSVLKPYADRNSSLPFNVYLWQGAFEGGGSEAECDRKLFFVALYSVLKYYNPHTNLNEAQREKSFEGARNNLKSCIQDLAKSEGSRLCQGIISSPAVFSRFRDLLKHQLNEAETVQYPDGKTAWLSDFYTVPQMECSKRGYKGVFSLEPGTALRTMVIGDGGKGKTNLTKAVVCVCLGNREKYREIKKDLDMAGGGYIPLVIHCKDIADSVSFDGADLLGLGVDQLVRGYRRTAHGMSWGSDIEEYRQVFVDLYKQLADTSRLLLIIEDLSYLGDGRYDGFVRSLKKATDIEYPALHVMITTKKLHRVQKRPLSEYNEFEIATFKSFDLEVEALERLKIGNKSSIEYLLQNKENKLVREFVNTPEGLVRFICYPFNYDFSMEKLIADTVEEYLAEHCKEGFSDDDCRGFLTALALYIIERPRFSGYRENQKAIPSNIISNKGFGKMIEGIENAEDVWKCIQRRKQFVSVSNAVNSYEFTNRLFYCSLVADYYITLLDERPGVCLLNNFNYMSKEDFFTVAYMMLTRFSEINEDLGRYCSDAIDDITLLLLTQSIAACSMFAEKGKELWVCRRGIEGITGEHRIRSLYKGSKNREAMLRMLDRLLDANGMEEFEEKPSEFIMSEGNTPVVTPEIPQTLVIKI
ncbi:MAG: hypothetical protein E7675_07295 [Ruminococcaceae bacterium]|nr:hypothetical protein [Oscillospiraceae bacterium]